MNKNIEIRKLLNLLKEKKNYVMVLCDIKELTKINAISMTAGDIAISTTLERIAKELSDEDIIFRVGGDEFVVLLNDNKKEYCNNLIEKIKSYNKTPIQYDGKNISLSLHVTSLENYNDELSEEKLLQKIKYELKKCKE